MMSKWSSPQPDCPRCHDPYRMRVVHGSTTPDRQAFGRTCVRVAVWWVCGGCENVYRGVGGMGISQKIRNDKNEQRPGRLS